MTSHQLEQLENIRRIAERGRDMQVHYSSRMVDVFQHILDLVEDIKK